MQQRHTGEGHADPHRQAPADLGAPEEAIATLLGPILFAHLTETVPLDDGFAERTLERFLAAHRPR